MQYVKSLAFGLAGGLIGVAIWVAVGYGTGYEVGYIAWGLGLLAGLGVRYGSDDHDGPMYGVLAILIAVPCILLAKYLVVHLVFGNVAGKLDGFRIDDPNVMIAEEAQQIADEREKSGKPVAWPHTKDADDVPPSARFPADIWAEAQQRWNQLPEDQRQAKFKDHNDQLAEILGQVNSLVRQAAFRESFTFYDLLWFGLAALTAFRLGSGSVAEE